MKSEKPKRPKKRERSERDKAMDKEVGMNIDTLARMLKTSKDEAVKFIRRVEARKSKTGKINGVRICLG